MILKIYPPEKIIFSAMTEQFWWTISMAEEVIATLVKGAKTKQPTSGLEVTLI